MITKINLWDVLILFSNSLKKMLTVVHPRLASSSLRTRKEEAALAVLVAVDMVVDLDRYIKLI